MRYDDNGKPTGFTNHVSEALAEIPQWARKRGILAVVQSHMEAFQEIEAALWQMFTGRALLDCGLVILRQWGSIVGESYNGEDLEKYRGRIMLRVAVNRSDGGWKALNRVQRILFAGAESFAMWGYRKHLDIFVHGPPVAGWSRTEMERYLRLSKAAGDSLKLWRNNSGRPFICRSVNHSVGVDACGSIHDPDLGGRLSG